MLSVCIINSFQGQPHTHTKKGSDRSKEKGCSRTLWSGNNQAVLIETNSEVTSLKEEWDGAGGGVSEEEQLSLKNSSDCVME